MKTVSIIDQLVLNGITSTTVKKSDLLRAAEMVGRNTVPEWLLAKHRKVKHGVYEVPEVLHSSYHPQMVQNTINSQIRSNADVLNSRFQKLDNEMNDSNNNSINVVEESSPVDYTTDSGYIQWGHYQDISNILSDDMFTTIYLTGLSGNGKTSMIQNICQNLGRKCYRINIISTTDEEDLIGGYELSDGNTVWNNRSVVEAMEEGAVLLLDEIDLATERIMCLQSILEGEGVFVKKQNKWVTPKTGFSIVATANTKGRGSDDGKYMYTNIQNEAFLDRFDFTFEQEYPPYEVEKQILTVNAKKFNIPIDKNLNDFIEKLCQWSKDIRYVQSNGGSFSDVVSTRRLIGIIKAYKKFNDKMKALNIGLSRYDNTTKQGFISYYKKIDDTIGGIYARSIYN